MTRIRNKEYSYIVLKKAQYITYNDLATERLIKNGVNF